MKPSTKTIRQQAAQAVIETHNENAVLRVEIARMRPVFKAALRLDHARFVYYAAPSGSLRNGEFLQKFNLAQHAFDQACARAARKGKGK